MSRTLTVVDREKVLAKAWSMRGASESPPYSNRCFASIWYGMIGPWCAMFVSWMFYIVLGFSPFPATTRKGFAYCPTGEQWFRNRGKWAGKHVRPKRGWVVFYKFTHRTSHVGVVLDVLRDGRIHTIEGNTNGRGGRDGGSVMEHYRSTATVVGYGIIDYVAVSKPPTKPRVPPPVNGLPMLQRGSKGDHVVVLQTILRNKANQKNIKIDGYFGWATKTAVQKLQAWYGLETSGIVGPKTWGVLKSLR